MKNEVTTPEMTPSPTLKPEIRMDNEISPMKPLPPPTEARPRFSYEQGSPKQKTEQKVEKEVEVEVQKDLTESLAPDIVIPTPASQPSFPLRTTSLDPPEPSPSVRPSTAPAPQSTFTATHPLPPTNLEEHEPQPEVEEPFIPLTKQSIPLPITLIPRITPSQLSCYTQHRTNVWSNNVFQPMGCMVCHSNEKDRKFSCTWCQLRICRGCSEELRMIPGGDLGALLKAREMEREKEGEGDGQSEFRVVVEDADHEEEVYEESEREGRGRSMMKVDSRERNEVVTPRE